MPALAIEGLRYAAINRDGCGVVVNQLLRLNAAFRKAVVVDD